MWGGRVCVGGCVCGVGGCVMWGCGVGRGDACGDEKGDIHAQAA